MVATTGWSYEQAKQHYFMYLERIGTADLLHELKTTPITANADVEQLAETFYRNLRSTAHAATAPFFTAMMGAANGRMSSIELLMEKAAAPGGQDNLHSAIALLQDRGAFIRQSFETLRVVHERNVMPEAFQALLRQGTAMAWGSFETFCADLFRLLFTRDLRFLRLVVVAQANGTPWADTPKKLLDWIVAEVAAGRASNNEAAFDTFKRLPTMQLRAIRHFSDILFSSDATLLALLDAQELGRLSARRHLLMHAAGVVDQQYLTATREALAVGSDLVVTPRELALGFRAVSSAGAALARAAASVL